jgi:signal transduction histidine kinase
MLRKCLSQNGHETRQNSIDIDEDYRNEFSYNLIMFNIKRERVLAVILMVLTFSVISVNVLTLDQKDLSSISIILLIRLFSSLFIAAALFLLLTYKIKKVEGHNYKMLKNLHLLINFTVLILSSLAAVNATVINQQPFSYAIAILSIASIIYLSPRERVRICIIPNCIYIVGILVVMQDRSIIVGNCIYTILLMMFALVISNINYSAYLKNFTQTKIIELKNQELDILYKKTDETLKIRTEELSLAKEYEMLRTAFFANLSHELRTPINVIFSAEQMIDHLSKNEDKKWSYESLSKYRKIIKQNCFRLMRMVSNLIDITKIDAGYFKIDMKNCNIAMIVEDITLSVAEYIESRNIELIFDTEIEEKVIACDPDKIERIMLNLLSNSVKYTAVGGQILVRIFMNAAKLAISVKDNGVGIPEKMKAMVFERFVQVDRSSTRVTEGSGIGLSIVKALVELQEGSIYLESELGRGTEFIIELPDRQINGEYEVEEIASTKEQRHIEKIHIEFSDMYD